MNKKDDALKLALSNAEGLAKKAGEAGNGLLVARIVVEIIAPLREALADHIVDANRMVEQPPCKTGSQCTSKCPQREQPAQDQGQSCSNCEALSKQVTALKTCLEVERGFREQEQPAQPEQEHVAQKIWEEGAYGPEITELRDIPVGAFLYMQPAQPGKPLTDEQEYEAIGTAGNDLLALAKRWADNEIHVYQFDNEARKIIKAVLHRAHAKGDA